MILYIEKTRVGHEIKRDEFINIKDLSADFQELALKEESKYYTFVKNGSIVKLTNNSLEKIKHITIEIK